MHALRHLAVVKAQQKEFALAMDVRDAADRLCEDQRLSAEREARKLRNAAKAEARRAAREAARAKERRKRAERERRPLVGGL